MPTGVAQNVARCLIEPPEPDGSIEAVIAEGFKLAQRRPAEVMALDEDGELDDDALDEGLWFALLGAGVSCETLASFPEAVRMYYATRLIEWEVGNGGFSQAIHNAATCFPDAIAGYELVGDHASAELLRRALESSHDEQALNALDEGLDGPPWHGVPWGDERRIAYVRAHRNEFQF